MDGLNRSKYLAEYLANMGYQTSYAGVGSSARNPANQSMVDMANVVITVHPFVEYFLGLRRQFEDTGEGYVVLENKRVIGLDVPETDIGRELEDVYRDLREQIELHLPL